jgi:cellulose synthase/poly-beta-1,6-N-acetylglucosamine synthase-like glycosyltransferase
MSDQSYVLITPARDAARTLEQTIEAVAAQTRRPEQWVIVSDASSDGTDAIAQRSMRRHGFIRFLRMDREGGRDFGSKVHAINAAVELLAQVPYAYLGNLDADITFEPDYFESLLQRFTENERLGIAGGVTFDVYGGGVHARGASLDSVGGAVQLFRRACYEQIGGYRPLRLGSEDALALHMARWKGWETRSFPDLPVMHHNRTGAGNGSVLRTRFHQGVVQGTLGWSASFVLLRALYRSMERPYVVGSMVRTLGYFWMLASPDRDRIPPELLSFIRAEQHQKLRAALSGQWYPWRTQ